MERAPQAPCFQAPLVALIYTPKSPDLVRCPCSNTNGVKFTDTSLTSCAVLAQTYTGSSPKPAGPPAAAWHLRGGHRPQVWLWGRGQW
eukprot:scaffold62330_cov18-Tisochrysis_lutea.AAC.3